MTTRNQWIYIKAIGRLDNFTFETLAHRLRTLVQMGNKNIVIDLSNVDYINIASIRLLVSIAKKLKNNDGELQLLGSNNKVLSLVEFFGKKYITFQTHLNESN